MICHFRKWSCECKYSTVYSAQPLRQRNYAKCLYSDSIWLLQVPGLGTAAGTQISNAVNMRWCAAAMMLQVIFEFSSSGPCASCVMWMARERANERWSESDIIMLEALPYDALFQCTGSRNSIKCVVCRFVFFSFFVRCVSSVRAPSPPL